MIPLIEKLVNLFQQLGCEVGTLIREDLFLSTHSHKKLDELFSYLFCFYTSERYCFQVPRCMVTDDQDVPHYKGPTISIAILVNASSIIGIDCFGALNSVACLDVF